MQSLQGARLKSQIQCPIRNDEKVARNKDASCRSSAGAHQEAFDQIKYPAWRIANRSGSLC